ncbi:GAF domain-containing protein [Actinoplanes sp. TRM 88003]|uniref:GAF domain-containing protein n=1 Tax=Paractinoplanes aksuensis TaxID=2939490 RepID=A0ABT1DI26_9ACTN|nr:GAF domain-containing protein [Actinoplanes aksuensis]MCO8269766.1 GAF domain-containing protein [Actinoplanes aksuensis]
MGSQVPADARAQAELRWAVAERQRIELQVAEMRAHLHQRAIDAEVAETRRRLLADLRRGAGRNGLGFLDPGFLALADRPTIAEAVLESALVAGRADFCDLRGYDAATAGLHRQGQRGFDDDYLAFFDGLGGDRVTAWSVAAATREAVLIDDVLRSPVFGDRAILDTVRAAGVRAVYSYPLLDSYGVLYGVLSLHYRRPSPRHGMPELVAAGAARALTAS